MRKLLSIVLFVGGISSACSTATEPTDESKGLGSSLNVSGSWTGVMASANNPTESITMQLTQSSGSVSGTWRGTEVAWSGQVSGTLSSGSFSGQMTFSGSAFDGNTCTGTATVSGTASNSKLAWTSAVGVVGGACAAQMPAGVAVDMSR